MSLSLSIVPSETRESDEAMADQDRPEGERRSGDDRRAADSWFGRNAMAVIAMAVGIVSGVFGSWVTTQVRETKTELALAHIDQSMSELKGKVDATSATVNAGLIASGKLQSDMQHMGEKIQEEASARGELGARTIINEKDIAYLKAIENIKQK